MFSPSMFSKVFSNFSSFPSFLLVHQPFFCEFDCYISPLTSPNASFLNNFIIFLFFFMLKTICISWHIRHKRHINFCAIFLFTCFFPGTNATFFPIDYADFSLNPKFYSSQPLIPIRWGITLFYHNFASFMIISIGH